MMRPYTRTIDINADIDMVGDYVSQVPNLPNWTSFFLKVGERVDGKYKVESRMGPIQTWIEQQLNTDGRNIAICSVIRDKVEKAYLDLSPKGGATHLQFTIRLPVTLPSNKVAEQLKTLEQELVQLKKIIEVPT